MFGKYTLALAGGMTGLLLLAAVAADRDAIPWRTDAEQAAKDALAQGRVLVLHFYFDECPPCAKMKAVTFTDPAVVRLLRDRRVIPVLVNTKSAAGVPAATKHHVRVVPADVFIKADGVVFKHLVGYHDPVTYAETLQAALAPPAD